MSTLDPTRLHSSQAPIRPERDTVLYWMTATRRTRWSHALDHAAQWARDLGKPLVVLEALRLDAPWASARTHRFVMQGMADNARRFNDLGIAYHPYVEPEPGAGRGLLEALANQAALVVTDAFPVHFLPRMTQAAARKLDVRLDVVDSLGLVPVAYPEREFTVAHSFRRWLQKNLPSLWHPPSADALGRDLAGATIGPDIHHRWPALGLGRPTGGEPLPETHLRGTPGTVSHRGGEAMARHLWQDFVRQRLDRYAEDRNHPDLPGSTRLSAWIHFGHIGVWELVDDLTRTWDPTTAAPATAKRDWWGLGEPVDALLEELINWRELCAVQAHRDPGFTTYEGLPAWARTTLDDHRDDPRPTLYSLDELEQAQTDDELWNAAQRELVQTGQMHNAMRMLWGKRVLAWSATPEEAFERLVTLNNRWALDGRDPNSWGGIGWVFGRFDRAWGPERPIYGKVRYMTSASSRRKWRMRDYLTTYGP